MNDRTLASLIEEHTRLYTADYDSRAEEAAAFERVDEILAALRTRCKGLEPAPEDDALLAVLVGALESEDAEVHDPAYVGLGRLGHPGVVPIFLERFAHGKGRYSRLMKCAKEADAEMAKTLRACLRQMPGKLEDRCFMEIAVHLAETRHGAARDPSLLRRATATPHEAKHWIWAMAQAIGELDVSELPDEDVAALEPDALERVSAGVAPGGWVRGLAWSPDGNRMYVGIQEPESASGLRTFDGDGGPLEEPRLEGRALTDLSLSSDGRWVAVAAREGRSAIVDAESGEVVREVDEGIGSTMPRVAFSPDDRHVAFCGNQVVVLSADDWSVVDTFRLPMSPAVKAAREWLSMDGSEASETLSSLDVPDRFRFLATRMVEHDSDESADEWRLLSDSLPDTRPSALVWTGPDRLLVGGQAVFEMHLGGGEPRRVYVPDVTTAETLWPDSRVVGLGHDERYVWVATRDGVVRLDHQFQNGRSFLALSFGTHIIPAEGRVFVGCYGRGGFWCIEGDEAKPLDGPVNAGAIALRSDGTVWCGDRNVSGWSPDLTPLAGPQHTETIVGIFEDAEGHGVTCDEGGNLVRHGVGTITHVPDSGRCISADASPGAEHIALGIETRRAGEMVCLHGDELLWRKATKHKPWCPLFRDEHLFFVVNTKLQRCTLDGADVRTKKMAKLAIEATPLGSDCAAYGYDQRLVIVDLAKQKLLVERVFEERMRALAGSPDGRRLCIAFDHGTVDVIDVEHMQLEAVVHAGTPRAVTCTEEAVYVVSSVGRLVKHAFGAHTVETLGVLPLESPMPSAIGVVGDEVWIGDDSGVLIRAPLDAR